MLDTIAVSLGSYLRYRREGLHPELSVRDVAERVGVDVSYLSRVEQDKVPASGKLLARLAPILGEDPDVLLAMAGKISQELQAIICTRPRVFADLLRQLKDAPDEAVEKAARIIRDGDW